MYIRKLAELNENNLDHERWNAQKIYYRPLLHVFRSVCVLYNVYHYHSFSILRLLPHFLYFGHPKIKNKLAVLLSLGGVHCTTQTFGNSVYSNIVGWNAQRQSSSNNTIDSSFDD